MLHGDIPLHLQLQQQLVAERTRNEQILQYLETTKADKQQLQQQLVAEQTRHLLETKEGKREVLAIVDAAGRGRPSSTRGKAL